ncbi:MAG TPA: penicillin-binding protein 2, partial [Propionibacteriaceae bacterium]|nr:penicillin-binding protein 2 [Propionibacteriaceae bacterium]
MTGERRPTPTRTAAGRSGQRTATATSRPRPRSGASTRGSQRTPVAPRRRRPPMRLPMGRPALRIQVAMIILGMLGSLLVVRAVVVQGIDGTAYAAQAARQMSVTRTIVASRGTISDRYGQSLAVSEPAVNIIADPSQIATNGKLERSMKQKDKEKAAAGPAVISGILAKYLGGDPSLYVESLTRNTKYSIVAKQVPRYTYLKITQDLSEAGYVGIYSESNPIRTYPNSSLASNVIGFVNSEGEGAGGLEYLFNTQLSGIDGSEAYQTSPNGKIPTGQNVLVPAQNGVDYTLTIDAGLQYQVERRLQEAVDAAKASSGIVIVSNVNTGELLALANYPTFNANSPGTAIPGDLGNRAATDPYEPGSVQKVLTMAALLDQGVITPDTKVKVPSFILSGGRPINDAFSHKDIQLTARGVVANSSNIGTVMLARQMDKRILVEYLAKFGLGKKTGMGWQGESAGGIPGADIADHTRDQIAFGQGLSVTALQEAAAVAAVTNGGVYRTPTIVKSATTTDGKAMPVPEGEERRVISPEASAQVLDMMESVVASKVGKNRFPIEGYRMAAKSGAAERVDPACKCYNGYVASFVGVAPVESPEILVYVVIDRPTAGQIQGSQIAAPVVKDVMKLALPRYGVAPST